jgi:hypothetical protein
MPILFRHCICITAFVALLASILPAAPPTTKPHQLTPEEDKQQMLQQFTAQGDRFPSATLQSLGDALRFSVVGDYLQASLKPGLNNAPAVRLKLPDPAVIPLLQMFPPARNGPNAGKPSAFIMTIRDFSQPGAMTVFTTVSVAMGRLEIARDYESEHELGSVQLIEQAPPMYDMPSSRNIPIRLYISRINQDTGKTEVKLNLTAANFTALRREHPDEVREYLRPIMHYLGQESAVFAPNTAEIWQVLSGNWKPDADVAQSVKTLVAKFDSADFHERESASHGLHELGEPAALALMHIDRSQFSAAENSGVDTFLAPYLPLKSQEARQLSTDREFLLDCQYSPDPVLRKLAADQLAKVTGKPIGFDPAADDATRLDQIAKLRQDAPTTAAGPRRRGG